jgi:hypothetical protein
MQKIFKRYNVNPHSFFNSRRLTGR